MKTARMHGKVNFGCLTLIILLVAGGYVGFKFGRVYMAKYMLDKRKWQGIPLFSVGSYAYKTHSYRFPASVSETTGQTSDLKPWNEDIFLSNLTDIDSGYIFQHV